MVWSRSLRVFLVIVLAVALTVLGLPPGPERARAATGDAVVLAVPTLVHSTGAELSWSRFAGPSLFDSYQVQRKLAGTADWRLLVRIHDPDTTRWVDTTAKPGSLVSYRVVVNGADASNQVNLSDALPAEGSARLTLQPDAVAGTATYMVTGANTPSLPCVPHANYGGAANLRIGISATGYRHRPLLRFDLRRIPPGAQVSSATLTLWHGLSSAAPDAIDLYRVTRAWEEGRADYPGVCDGSGADWKEARAGLAWSAGGGDFDPALQAIATRNTTSGYDGSR